MAAFKHMTDPMEFEIQWHVMHTLPDLDLELYMELLK